MTPVERLNRLVNVRRELLVIASDVDARTRQVLFCALSVALEQTCEAISLTRKECAVSSFVGSLQAVDVDRKMAAAGERAESEPPYPFPCPACHSNPDNWPCHECGAVGLGTEEGRGV